MKLLAMRCRRARLLFPLVTHTSGGQQAVRAAYSFINSDRIHLFMYVHKSVPRGYRYRFVEVLGTREVLLYDTAVFLFFQCICRIVT